MAKFTCPKCAAENVVDAPNGESWWDGNTEEMDCQACDAHLYINVQVEITLSAEPVETEVGEVEHG